MQTELAEREWVPRGAGNELAPRLARGRTGDRVEQLRGGRVVERREVQASQPGLVQGVRVPRRHHHDDRVLRHATGDHAQCPCGRGVDPVQVLGDDQERGRGRGVGEQGQRREPGEER
ncbi:hypothetical protein [Curtobacterium sp. MCBD17_032]|uniref:hypothetical protein n=1 Tax=Curtobacterium sp. MCBD17_032 TaxID=2175659 RepID=UPI0021AC0D78|nr:hypothetical protein [Curtobacterium sp. MCBD17_032]